MDAENTCKGHIDVFRDGFIEGWFYSPTERVRLLVTVDGFPVNAGVDWIKREDVDTALALTGVKGFRINVPFRVSGNAEVAVYAVSIDRSELLHVRQFSSVVNIPATTEALDLIARASQSDGAVAIVVWDGTHNPLGRAKVLYDIVSQYRQACIIAFNFDFSPAPIWEPLRTEDIPIYMLRWNDRQRVKAFLDENAISFNTIWACKPRLPTFELATMFGNEETRYILDIDDNEAHLCDEPAAIGQPYGLLGYSRAKSLMRQMPARSVVSQSLQQKYGGELVRHVRKAHAALSDAANTRSEGNTKRVAFIGTVRPHKGLRETLMHIAALNQTASYNVELHIGGNFLPAELRDELADAGAHIIGPVANDKLNDTLSGFDVILTGFPSENAGDSEITDYQISSKIGDALACGKPVLTPDGPSVDDLDYPGIFRFTVSTFETQLRNAIEFAQPTTLPDEFTREHAYTTFTRLEKQASEHTKKSKGKKANRLKQLFGAKRGITPLAQKNIVLVWKQNDASIYGRRVDIIARALKKQYPDTTVRVLEFCTPNAMKHHQIFAADPASDSSIILDRMKKKNESYRFSDAIYENLNVESVEDVSCEVNAYLLGNSLLPTNCSFILFPLIPAYRTFINAIHGYSVIVDVVDNQTSWIDNEHDLLNAAYEYKSLFTQARAIIFNSQPNLDAFASNGLLDDNLREKAHHIPNWYEKPAGEDIQPAARRSESKLKAVYSGNMNDRVDWALLNKIATTFKDSLILTVIGNGGRAKDELSELVRHDNVIYLGPLDEVACLQELIASDIAVMPHVTDGTSKFMNPLKVKMYNSVGLPCISSDVPGLDNEENLIIAESDEAFLGRINEMIQKNGNKGASSKTRSYQRQSERYLSVFRKFSKI